MKNKSILLILITIFLIVANPEIKSQNPNFPILKGDFMGQKIPDTTAVIFAPGIISTGLYERDISVSADGNEIYYSLFLGNWNTIMVTTRINGIWREPVVAEFARDTAFYFAEPALSFDGNTIFYLSTKPRENEVAKPGWSNQNIWFSERQKNGSWGIGKPLPQNINEFEEFYPSLTKEGTLYFCRTDLKSKNSKILRSKLKDGIYQNPEILPDPINAKGSVFNACIAPDDSYLIGCVSERDTLKPKGVASYMIFFHNPDNTWSQGVDLTEVLKLPCPNAISVSVTPDGKYLFFASTYRNIWLKGISKDWSFSFLSNYRNQPGNGNSDIYWIDISRVLPKLKKLSSPKK